VLWNDAVIGTLYPKIPSDARKSESEWFALQKFSQDNTKFRYYWNWDLTSRYTGHHYDLLEKLATFAKAQPRKGLWERNERFYIPTYHGPYDTKFRTSVDELYGSDIVWGAPSIPELTPIGPKPPVPDPKDDDYTWGIGEEADLISLSPIFNPTDTTWPGADSVWGYTSPDTTPLRATTTTTHSRSSKRLLDAMHAANLRGTHLHADMAPPTIALLHGLKTVYAPHPLFFDRAWGPDAVRFLNPGPRGESGSTADSPFGEGHEDRLSGSTWFASAEPPGRLWGNWMGREEGGVGGVEWEAQHGRICLPPMLLHPVTDAAA